MRSRRERVNYEAVYAVYRKALRDGTLVRPARCEACSVECRPHGHHVNYALPLAVEWLCHDCHQKRHRHRLRTFVAARPPRVRAKPLPVRPRRERIMVERPPVRIQSPEVVGRRLASVRTLRGLTQAELAAEAKVTGATISRAESGMYSADTLVKLNRVLDSSLDYILYGEGAP